MKKHESRNFTKRRLRTALTIFTSSFNFFMTTLAYLIAYLGTIACVAIIAKHVLKYLKNPQHLRWELYPVGHENQTPFPLSLFSLLDFTRPKINIMKTLENREQGRRSPTGAARGSIAIAGEHPRLVLRAAAA